MTSIGRYIFRQAFMAFALVMGTLIGILWLTQALTKMSLVVDQGQTAMLFIKITLYALPTLITVIAPIALFAACVHTLNRLNADSELVIVNAAGASRWTIISPFVALGLIVTFMTAWIGLIVMPDTANSLRQIFANIRADVLANIIEPGDFTTIERDMTFHIRERGRDGSLLGVLVSDARNPKETLTYIAERGQIASDGDASFLVLEKGNLQQSSKESGSTNFVAFDRYMIDLSSLEGKAKKQVVHPRERTTAELLFPDNDERYFKVLKGRFRAELHRRFAAIFYPLASVFIALAFVGFARTTRQNRVSGVIMAIATMAFVRILGFVVDKLTVKHFEVAWVNYAIPIGAMTIAATFAMGYGRWALPFLSYLSIDRYWDTIIEFGHKIRARVQARRRPVREAA